MTRFGISANTSAASLYTCFSFLVSVERESTTLHPSQDQVSYMEVLTYIPRVGIET